MEYEISYYKRYIQIEMTQNNFSYLVLERIVKNSTSVNIFVTEEELIIELFSVFVFFCNIYLVFTSI